MAFSIDGAFPGGNIVVEKTNADTAFLRQDIRDTEGTWFYWCFRVRGAAGKRLTFRFTGSPVIGACGPAVSADAGISWRWLGRECVRDNSFTAVIPGDDVHFSVGMPYQQEHLWRFCASREANAHLSAGTLCRSRQGRDVETVSFGCLAGEPLFRVAFTCRHHACEMMANYVLEGFIDETLSPSPEGIWLRDAVEFFSVPFVDKDGVENGDQGKNRIPHDHNRDYAGVSLYPEVAALREFLPGWSGSRLVAFLDLHCPYLSGEENEEIFLVGSPVSAVWHAQQAFARTLARVAQGPLPFSADCIIPFGTTWNVAHPPDLLSSTRWATSLPGMLLATTIEIPYARAGRREVNQKTARAFGRDLARAVCVFLREEVRNEDAWTRESRG